MNYLASPPKDNEDPSHLSHLQTLAWLVGIALILATLCNGAGFYLRKVGFIEPEAYRTYWALLCSSSYRDSIEAPGPGCRPLLAGNDLRPPTAEDVRIMQRFTRSAYETPIREIPLKLVKDALGVALIGLSAFLIARRKAALPDVRQAWPILLLAGYAVVSFLASWAANGAITATVGLRPFMFIVIALTCRWLAPHLSIVAYCIAALLGAEALLASLEIFKVAYMTGHVFSVSPSGFYSLPTRATGTLILTNTMGAFAATALAFYYTFSRTRSWLPIMTSIALALIFVSGSATGVLCILFFLFFIIIERIKPERRPFVVVVGILALLMVVSALPVITGRPTIFDSLFGEGARIDVFRYALADKSAFELMLGRGIGLNTNLALNLLRQADPDTLAATATLIPPPTDSTVTGLIVQIGILGTLIFYGCILWAGLRDRSARMFYVIIFLCSLTLNVPEVFPVNFLLGLALAHSLAVTPRK